MHKILVTGATGFVGINLCPFLTQKGFEITALSIRDNQWEQSDLNGNQAIVHLAGKAHDTSNTADDSVYFEVNRDKTIKLFDKFLESDVQTFIYFSSVKAVADTLDKPLVEKVVPSPKTPYGISKQEAETYLLSKQLPAGKQLFILRPCMIHGPGNKGNLNLLYKFVQKGIPYPLADFENKRSFLSIQNLEFIIHELLNVKGAATEIFNVADDEAISTNELVKIIGAGIDKQPKLLAIPKGLIKWMAKVGDTIKLPLNSERLKKMTESYEVDNTKIKKYLQISKLPISVSEGLKRTIQSFK